MALRSTLEGMKARGGLSSVAVAPGDVIYIGVPGGRHVGHLRTS